MGKPEKYSTVNGVWPEGTNDGRSIVVTDKDAIHIARRLYRLMMKRPFKGPVRIARGNRYTYVRGGVMYVNPNWRGHGGLHELVHILSHHIARRLFPKAKGHSHQHAFVEREMIAYVIAHGLHQGTAREPSVTPEEARLEKRADERTKLAKRLAVWETKAKRARTAIAKLRTAIKAHDRYTAKLPRPGHWGTAERILVASSHPWVIDDKSDARQFAQLDPHGAKMN